MSRICNRYVVAAWLAVLVVGGLVFVSQKQAAFGRAEDKPAASGPHYTVLETEGTNLIVTDNSNNTLYFYTVDKGAPLGSELHLRATVDLTQVGKPTLKGKAINIQK